MKKQLPTPTKKQWQAVIDNFKKVLPFAKKKNHLNMMETTAMAKNHKCGTIHCVAGWYAVALLKDGTINESEYVSYSDGAAAIAKQLGFKNDSQLESWANRNPDIWGNEDGINMFYSKKAYNGAKSLIEVVIYLEGVRDRSPE